MKSNRIDFGKYLHQLRMENGYSQRIVADKLNIDISLLSKIEHGERQVQGHMLKPVSELFYLDYRELQLQYLSQKIDAEIGSEPFAKEAVEKWLTDANSKKNG
jgi:transcriptional regulator with XRE-family HTH domain